MPLTPFRPLSLLAAAAMLIIFTLISFSLIIY
jgi:hypothetical protein